MSDDRPSRQQGSGQDLDGRAPAARAHDDPAAGVELFAFVKVSHAAVVRVLCSVAGLGGLIFDTEHGAFTDADLESLCSIASLSGLLSVIRTPSSAPEAVGRALDRGARGVLVPRVRTVREVELAARALRFAPGGLRGFDPTVSGHGYGDGDGSAGPATAPRLFVQVETTSALERVGPISRVDGVTDLFVGPADLAQELGEASRMFAPAVLEAMRQVAEDARGSGVNLVTFVDTPERARLTLSWGYRSVAVGSDVGFLRAGAARVADFRLAMSEAPRLAPLTAERS